MNGRMHTTTTGVDPMTTLTSIDIEAGHDDPRWLGFGYLGERQRALDTSDPEATVSPAAVARADALVLEVANARGWDRERLLQWRRACPGTRSAAVRPSFAPVGARS